jgi:hypothetical protein
MSSSTTYVPEDISRSALDALIADAWHTVATEPSFRGQLEEWEDEARALQHLMDAADRALAGWRWMIRMEGYEEPPADPILVTYLGFEYSVEK